MHTTAIHKQIVRMMSTQSQLASDAARQEEAAIQSAQQLYQGLALYMARCSHSSITTTGPARKRLGRRASNPTTMYMEMSLPPARRSAASRSCLVSGSSCLSSARRRVAARRRRAPPCSAQAHSARQHALLSLNRLLGQSRVLQLLGFMNF